MQKEKVPAVVEEFPESVNVDVLTVALFAATILTSRKQRSPPVGEHGFADSLARSGRVIVTGAWITIRLCGSDQPSIPPHHVLTPSIKQGLDNPLSRAERPNRHSLCCCHSSTPRHTRSWSNSRGCRPFLALLPGSSHEFPKPDEATTAKKMRSSDRLCDVVAAECAEQFVFRRHFLTGKTPRSKTRTSERNLF